MKRLTTDTPNGNFETMLNFVYGKDGWAYIRHDGEHEDVLLTDWAKRQCKFRGCKEAWTETPEEIDQRLCDCMMDEPICPIALAYCFASQAVHLRSRLKMYEDTGVEPKEIEGLKAGICLGCSVPEVSDEFRHIQNLLQAEKDGRLVVLPCKVRDLLYEIDLPEYGVITCKALEVHAYIGPDMHVQGAPMVSAVNVSVEVIDGHGKGSGYTFEILDFGKTVFLSREEAEAALKKREEADNETD